MAGASGCPAGVPKKGCTIHLPVVLRPGSASLDQRDQIGPQRGGAEEWDAAKGLGNAARDLGWGTLDAAADIAGRFQEAYHGFVDDQPALQEDHVEHADLKKAMQGRRENILRDLGIHDGERDPDPEKSAGLNNW